MAVGKFTGVAGVAFVVAVAVGVLATVMITVTATPGFGVGVVVVKVLADDVVGLGVTAVSQLVSKTRVKNNPATR